MQAKEYEEEQVIFFKLPSISVKFCVINFKIIIPGIFDPREYLELE